MQAVKWCHHTGCVPQKKLLKYPKQQPLVLAGWHHSTPEVAGACHDGFSIMAGRWLWCISPCVLVAKMLMLHGEQCYCSKDSIQEAPVLVIKTGEQQAGLATGSFT